MTGTDKVTAIAQRLRDDIRAGRLAPGGRIVESRLARELGLGRGPIREAARLLESEGLLGYDPNGGFSVRRLTLRELAEVFDVRLCLEIRAAVLVAARRDSGLIATLEARFETIQDRAAAQDARARSDADFDLHRQIVVATGNARLLRIHDRVAADLRLILSLIDEVEDPARIAQSHRPLIDALASGDPDLAASATEAHIRLFWDEVLHKVHESDAVALVPITGADRAATGGRPA